MPQPRADRSRRLGLAALAGALVATAANDACAGQVNKAKLAEVRSLTAEAAALERAAAAGQVTTAFADALRKDLRRDLLAFSRTPALQAPANRAVQALARRDAAALAVLSQELVAQERSHGRAD